MTYRLGKGWDEVKHLDYTSEENEDSVKYADLGIYRGDECIVPLRIDHHEIILDGRLDETYPKLAELVRKLNEAS